jgi:hypothetical protein
MDQKIWNPDTKRFVKLTGKVCKELINKYKAGVITLRDEDKLKLRSCGRINNQNNVAQQVQANQPQVQPQNNFQTHMTNLP